MLKKMNFNNNHNNGIGNFQILNKVNNFFIINL